jgi:glycosyltransferase involved in cell wall biosynthesis
MRICIDTQSTGGQKTGIGRYASDLMASLREIAPEHDYLGINPVRTVKMRTNRRLLWQQVQVPRIARRLRADLIHLTGFDVPVRRPCPAVLTVHDLIGMLFPADLPLISRLYWAFWLPYTMRFASHIVAVSEHTKLDITRLLHVPAARITVIQPGVGSRFTPLTSHDGFRSFRRKHGLPKKYILFVGTLEPRKGLDTLLAAFRRLSVSMPDIGLVIAGKRGWFMDWFLAYAERPHLKDRIVFTGYVDDEDLPSMYNAAELFVLPSRYEGFGMPVLEAMACGTPVVCSNRASLPEVAGDSAFQVPPDDPEALGLAMREVLFDERLRKGMRQKGLTRAGSFSWKKAARSTLDIYRKVLGIP